MAGFALAHADEPTGFFRFEERLFPLAPLRPSPIRHLDAALSTEIGFQAEPAPGLLLNTRAFARLDEKDPERTRFDLPEFQVQYRREAVTLEMGATRVFWGVTESRHLVDIVNQVDWSGDMEGEQKLGQPMIRIAWDHPRAGLLEALSMGYFRPRPFPGETGRPGFPYPLADDQPAYSSRLGRWHPDFALRWSHHLLGFDWALSGFAGTSREPRFRPEPAGGSFGLVPLYDLVRQGGLEFQFTSGACLWKLEALARQGQGPYFTAATGGLEYLWPGTRNGPEISLFVEHSWDSRRNGTVNALDNDLFTGFRIAWNTPSDIVVQAGTFTDVEEGTVLGDLEASRRFREAWLMRATGRAFSIQEEGLFRAFRRDHHLKLELQRVF